MTGHLRLSDATLDRAAPGVVQPAYDRAALPPGIVHLGLGAFVRAHLALYTEDVLALEPGPWGIVGVSLQRPDQRDRLQPQDGLYTTLSRDGDRTAARIVGCVRRVLVAPESPQAVLAALAECRIVSLTITEKGYCHDPATGRLDPGHPDIRHDLAHPAAPRSAIGFLAAALAARRREGAPPFTVLCCDNLPHNGRLLAGLLRDFAAVTDDALAGWIEREVACPSTMVDRIVSAVTDADLAEAASLTGLDDRAAVAHEPFRQWVIEARFGPLGRPSWERVGAQLVADVAPFELMKLRLLNGAHSALAYLGFLAGHQTIPDVVGDPVFRVYLRALWDEMVPTVPLPPGVDLRAYTQELLERFSNGAVRHRTWQIAADGSQKLPQRLLGTIRERRARELPSPCLMLAVAAWIRFVGGVDEAGEPIDVRDPMAAILRACSPAGVLALEPIFGADLSRDGIFVAIVLDAHAALVAQGARACLDNIAGAT